MFHICHILAVRLKTDLWKALSLHFLIVSCITLRRSENELRDRISQNNDDRGQAFALLAHSFLIGVTLWPSGLSNAYSRKHRKIDITFLASFSFEKENHITEYSVGNFRRVPGPYLIFCPNSWGPQGQEKLSWRPGPLLAYGLDAPPPPPPPRHVL